MTALETLVELRKSCPTPLSNAPMGELMNDVAWKHRAEGYGLLAKPNGAHCLQPQTGTFIARDILATTWTALFEEVDRLYGLADRPHDLGTFKWSVRTAYDIGAGMDKEKAKAKHLAELRAALGL